MSNNPFIDFGLICLEQFFYFIAIPTGTWRDATGRCVVRLHYVKKATITRDGVTTVYRRLLNGETSVLRRSGFEVVFHHHADGSMSDGGGTRFVRIGG